MAWLVTRALPLLAAVAVLVAAGAAAQPVSFDIEGVVHVDPLADEGGSPEFDISVMVEERKWFSMRARGGGAAG